MSQILCAAYMFRFVCLLTIMIFLTSASCARLAPADELDGVSVLLTDAGIRSDLKGVLQARQLLEKMLEERRAKEDEAMEASIRYHIAFANFQTMYITFGQMPEGKRLMEESLDHLEKAVRLKADFSDAYVLSALSAFYLSVIARENDSHRSQIPVFLEKARALSPDAITLATAEAFMTFRGDSEEIQEKIHRAFEIAEREIREKRPVGWWHVIPFHYMAMSHYYRGDLLKARKQVEQVLALRPDLEAVQSTLVPALQPKHAINPSMYSHLEWLRLAEDPQGDGQDPELADGRALSYHYDAATDRIWFRFEYHRLPDPSVFGVNIAVDVDANQDNGAKWWGGDSTFRFDKLITVWVRKEDDGNYYGTVGISDDASVRRMRLMQLGQNNIRFGSDGGKQEVLIGLQRTDLDPALEMRLIAAVGSDVAWNDNIPDSGFSTIHFPAGKQ